MNAKTKALKAHRARLKKRGLKRLEVCVPAGEAAVIRRAAGALREQSAEAAKLRQILGFAAEGSPPTGAVDLFAMTEPLSPRGEALWDSAMTQIEHDRKDSTLNRARKLDL